MSGSATRAGKAGQLTRLMIHPVDAYGNPGTVSPQDDLRLYINGQDLNVVPSNLSDTHYDFVIKYPKAGVYEVKNAVSSRLHHFSSFFLFGSAWHLESIFY